MKRQFSLSLFSRFILGSIFIYAGLYRIMNPDSINKTLYAYRFLSDSLASSIAPTFPWLLLILGALMISGYLARYVAIFVSILLLIIISLNMLSASRGSCQACGLFSELVFYKRGNPFVLLTITYLLLALSGTIFMSSVFSPNTARVSFRRQVVFPLSIFFSFFLILATFTFMGRRSYDSKYFSAASNERSRVIEDLKDSSLIGTDIVSISNIVFPISPDSRITVLLTLHSLECGSCADEAAFLEYLNAKYGNKIGFCAVVRKIGKTAIENFRVQYSITYPFIEGPGLLDFSLFSRYKSLLTIISRNRKILRIDPISLNVRLFREGYENVLVSYLE